MLNLRLIRDSKDSIISGLSKRGADFSADIDEIVKLDKIRRDMIIDVEGQKSEQNSMSKSIPLMKKKNEDVTELMSKMKLLSENIKKMDSELATIEKDLNEKLLLLPNVPNDCVPVGLTSDDNVEIRRHLEPTSFDFEPKPHWDIGEKLGILDPSTAASVTGSRFHFYKGLGARLERAIINYFLDTHTDNGYTEIFPPFIANTSSMIGTGQLPKFKDDMFAISNTDYFLIPTAEVPLTNMYKDSIIPRDMLPMSYCAYSACFRAEAGSAGRDARGLIRQHQFNKVELVKFAFPDDSYNELERLTNDAEAVLKGLGIPYRVVRLCSGDMGFSSACTYDIEVYMPSYNKYVEISSCSNFEDFQSRRAGIRTRDEDGKVIYPHTLNGSGVAVGRTVACILENFQNSDGSVRIPEVLIKYMNTDIIKE